MTFVIRPARARAAGLLGLPALALAACGGGGGGPAPIAAPPAAAASVTPTPTPPAPAPTPTPSFDTAEYRNSTAAVAMNAITAYRAGGTGANITVAVLDSGVNPSLPEFSGKLHPSSQDVSSTRGLGDDDGHGTTVAAVIGARKNDSDIHGVAFDSPLMILRTDRPGSCSTTGENEGCRHSDDNLARAVDIATLNGARVINMSLGGSAANANLRAALGRATRAGVVVVISAGNDSATEPDSLAQVALDPTASNGLVLIAGATNGTGQLASFSNRAGSTAGVYIAALGSRVATTDEQGRAVLGSGTSYAAPSVSGAVALLRSAFPNLSASQVVDILFRSADDAGAAGDDAEFGQGILNLTRAFAPQGSMTVAGSATAVSSASNGALGGAFGDGGQTGSALQGAVILDGFGRAFAIDLAQTIAATPQTRVLAELADRSRAGGAGDGTRSYSVTIAPRSSFRPWVGLAQQGLDAHADDRDQARQGLVTSLIGTTTRAGLAFGHSPERLAAAVGGGWSRGAFLAAGRATGSEAGFATRDAGAVALAKAVGRWTLSMAAGRATVDDPRPGVRDQLGRAETLSLRAERGIGPVRVAAGLTRLVESDTLLGSRSPLLGLQGGTTHFASLEARGALGRGWTLGAGARSGWTDARLGGGLIERLDTLRSFGFQADLSKDGLFGADRLDLRIAQPLRVEHGRAGLSVPVDYDYATLAPSYEARAVNLAPSGRELDVEAVYSARLLGGDLATHLYWRRDPGHLATRGDDMGAAIRFTLGL